MEPIFDETEATESFCSSSSSNDSRKKPTEGSMTIRENYKESEACASFADSLVNEITEQSLTDPVEILRFLRKNLVKGRVLYVQDIYQPPQKVKLTSFVLMGIISWNPHF